MTLILIAAIAGIAATMQANFMGVMDRSMGTLESMFLTYGIGGVVIGLAMLVYKGGNLPAWHAVPWYALTAGLLGLVIVGSIGYSAQRLGLVTSMTIIVATQFITAAILDHFGLLGAELRPLTFSRIGGMGVLLLGVWLIVR